MAVLVDTVRVRHVSGGVSTLTFKTYDQGRERWQGETLDLVAFDEEPPEDIYMEVADWWEEFRLYHREDGKVVKEHDDLMAASRYLIMSLRFAKYERQRPEETHLQQLLRRHRPGRSAMSA